MKKAFDRGDWDRVDNKVSLGSGKKARTRLALDNLVERFAEVTAAAVSRYTP